MKKEAILVFILLIIMPFVNAQNTFTEMLSYALGVNTQNSYLLLAFAIWVIIFALLFKLAGKVFRESKNISLVIALVISLIAVNFMPTELYTFLAQYMVFLVVVAVIISPWVLVDYFGRIPKKWRHFLLIIIYIIGIVLIRKLSNYATINNLLDTEFPFLIFGDVSFRTITYTALILASLISLYNMFKKTPKDIDEELENELKRAKIKQLREDAKKIAEERRRSRSEQREEQAAQHEERPHEGSNPKSNRDYVRSKFNAVRRIGINNLTNKLRKLEDELNEGYKEAGRLHGEATRKGWTKTNEGKEAYKAWYRQFNRNDNIKKEIKEITNRIVHLKKQL